MSNHPDQRPPGPTSQPRPSAADVDRSANEAPVVELEKHVSEIVTLAKTWDTTFAGFRSRGRAASGPGAEDGSDR